MREFLILFFVYMPIAFILVPVAIHVGLGYPLGLYDDLPPGRSIFVASYGVAFMALCLTLRVDEEPGKQLINLGTALLIFTAALIGDRPAVAFILFGAPVGVLICAALQVLMWNLDKLSGSRRPFPFSLDAIAERAAREKRSAEWEERDRVLSQKLQTANADTIALIAGEPGLNAPAVAKAIDLHLSHCRPLLEALAGDGLLRAENTPYGIRYYPAEGHEDDAIG